MLSRTVPSSGELLPVVGLGTWEAFDVGSSRAERAPLAEVLRVLFDAGGSVIDSSPMYGQAEEVVGDLLQRRERGFLATKVWTTGRREGIEQMERSMALLKTDRIDLMQVHNLVDYRVHLATLRSWKDEGRIRYVGVTHYTDTAYPQLEAVMRAEPLDFVQLNYSVHERTAEDRLLPLAAERGIAVLVNRPFGGNSGLLARLRVRPVPAWASEIGCTGWSQLLLKFIVSHPAVTCVIPGTRSPDHVRDNVLAGVGAMPDADLRERIAAAVKS